MLAVMKTLANLNVKDRRNKQEGKFGAKYDGKTYICHVDDPRRADRRTGRHHSRGRKEAAWSITADLGMREGLQKQWAEIMASRPGPGDLLGAARRRPDDDDECLARRNRPLDAGLRRHRRGQQSRA